MNETVVARTQSKRIPEVDGLRAIAIGLVMLYHFDLSFPGGFFGVDLFFAISGFVIMRQLFVLDPDVPAKTHLTTFYKRRVLRLVPAALALCATMVLAAACGFEKVGGVLSITWRNAAAGLSGVANWFTMTLSQRPSAETVPLQHMWSLSVEEQFYLALPLVLLPFRRRLQVGATVVGLFAIACALVTAVIAPLPSAGFFNTASRIAPVGAGVLLAAADERFGLLQRLRPMVMMKSVALFSLLAATFLLGLTVQWDARWLTRGGFVALAIPFAAIVALAAAGGNDFVSVVLRSPVLQYVGSRSYSLYLWHFPIAYLFATSAMPIRTILRFVLSLVLAEASFRFIESPARNASSAPLSRFAPFVPPAMVAVALITAFTGALRVA